MKYSYTTTTMAAIKKTDHTVVEKAEASHTAGQNGVATLEGSLAVSQKVEHGYTIQPSLSTPRIQLSETTTYMHTQMSANFTAVLFIITSSWRQFKMTLGWRLDKQNVENSNNKALCRTN